MILKKIKWKKNLWNILFFGFLLVFIISNPFRSWVFRQVLKTGLFSPGIEFKKNATNLITPMPLSFIGDNGTFHSTENMRGKNVFINFWASWCPYCVAEMSNLNEIYSELKSNPNVEFIFINLDDQPEKGREYLKKHKYDIPFQRAEGFIPTDLFGGTLPTTVVLNAEGKIIMKHAEMGNYNTREFKEKLTTLQ